MAWRPVADRRERVTHLVELVAPVVAIEERDRLGVGHDLAQFMHGETPIEVVEDKVLEEKVLQADLEEKIKLLSEGGYWLDAQSYIFKMGAKNNKN